MNVSLVITTYNWKEALDLSIKSGLQQSRLPEEIIIADDGSSDGTGDLVKKISENASIPIIHLWQEDKGFRAAMIRNKAIALAKGDYIVLIDGDIVLDSHFIEDHLASAREGFFVQGSRVIVGENLTRTALFKGISNFSVFSAGIENRKNCIRSHIMSRIFSCESKRLSGIKTCNFAFWRKDALAVNGFDEDFVGWGREDSEFAFRLIHFGILRKNLKFRAIAYHLYHNIQPRDRLNVNDTILEKTISNKSLWCQNGINKYFSGLTSR